MPGWRQSKRDLHGALPAAFAAFGHTLAMVEAAKEALTSAVPGRRGPGVALAEAVGGFEQDLRRAAEQMPSWRVPEVEAAWSACASAVQESLRRSEVFRLEASPDGYEHLYLALGQLMDPLGVFQDAVGRFQTLGLRPR
jgi:hypothetical protein